MITLTFINNKKIICCNLMTLPLLDKVRANFSASGEIAGVLGEVAMKTHAMYALTGQKNLSPNQFDDDFMVEYEDFYFNNFIPALEDASRASVENDVIGCLETARDAAHVFIDTYITDLD